MQPSSAWKSPLKELFCLWWKLRLSPRYLHHVIIMTKLKYNLLLTNFMMHESVYDSVQAKPRQERQVTYFCRLCRGYGIKTRKAHLQNFHNASRDTVTKRSNDDLVNTIFIEAKN